MKTLVWVLGAAKFLGLVALTVACLPSVVAGVVWTRGDEPFEFCPWVKL